jgi:hypothetical protein
LRTLQHLRQIPAPRTAPIILCPQCAEFVRKRLRYRRISKTPPNNTAIRVMSAMLAL